MNFYQSFLEKLSAEHRLRTIPENKTGLIDLVSNDYLGLAAREEEFLEEFFKTYEGISFTSSASRLLSRKQFYHNLLEEFLGGLYHKEVLLFNSGYHANAGILSALSNPNATFLVDGLMHASGLDGLMMGQFHRKAQVKKFRHNDMEHLEELIKETKTTLPDNYIIIVTESVFSMDGDVSPLRGLVYLKRSYQNILLYLDEAHGFGVRGQLGLGLAEETGVIPDIDLIVGTFGKAAASEGAFVATSPMLRDFILNTARSFIFSTAIPPVNVAWTHFMVGKILNMERERAYLKVLGREFNLLLNPNSSSDSQIVPYICGNAEKAVRLSRILRDNGFDTLPIRRPTVAPGSERIRFSLNASLKIEELKPINEILKRTAI